MQIKNKNGHLNKELRKPWAIAILTIVVLLVLVLFYLVFRPFDSAYDTSHNTNTQKNSSNKEDSSSEAEKNSKENANSDTNTSDNESAGDDDYQTITPPEITQPSNDSPYPIENARYRIDQNSATSFSITLYPIEGSDYDRQLKEYKQDALSYLKSRYGSIDKFKISWTPESAASL